MSGCAGDGSAPNHAAVSITSIVPAVGSAYGGTPVTITGTGFTTQSLVSIGAGQVTDVHVVSPTEITAVTGPENVSTVDVVVSTDGERATLPLAYTYLLPFAVESISPAIGSIYGGTTVTITGRNFTGGTTVTFGGSVATNVQIVSPTRITVVTPQHLAGVVDLAVSSAVGTSIMAGA